MSPRKPSSEDEKDQSDHTNRGNHHADLSLGGRLKMARMAKKLSASEVAQKIDISKQSVSYWEADRSEPRLDRLRELAKFYNVRFEWLTAGKGPMRVTDTETSEEFTRKSRERQQLLLETLQTVQKTSFSVARIAISHDEITLDLVTPDRHIRKTL